MMYYFFIYFAIYIAFLFVIGTVGISTLLVVRRKFELTFFESLLTALFSGYIISITIFSIIQTCFKTVNILYIILLLFALWEVVKMPTKYQIEKKDIEWKLALLSFGSTFFFYGLAFLSIYRPGCFIPFSYNHPTDYIFYAKISKYISLTGEENIFNFLNKLDSYYNGPYPYHYFDAWGAALTNYLFGINHYLGLKLIIYPTFYFIFFIGTICLFQKPNPMKILFSFIIIWYGGFYISEFQFVPFLKNLLNISTNLFSIYLSKLSFFYVFILNSYLFYRQKLYVLSTICFLGLIVANIITAPPVLIALFLLTLLSFRIKIISKEILYTNFIYLVIFSVLLVTFYRIFKSESAAGLAGEITSLIQESFSFQNLKTHRNIIIVSIIYLLILYFPVIFLLFKNRPLVLTKNLSLIFVVTSILISILIWAMLFYELNSSQIFYNFSTSIINVSAIILIITSFENSILSFRTKSISTWVLNFLIILTICTNVIEITRFIFATNRQLHSNEYLKKMYNSISENELIATLKSPTEMEEMHSKYNAVYPLGDYLFLFDKNVNSVNIGDLDTPIDSTSKMNRIRGYRAIRDGLFYRFAQFDENKNLSKSDLTIKFLEKFNIKFIIATKSAKLPQFLVENAKSIITDSLSGEKFIELNLKQKTINKH